MSRDRGQSFSGHQAPRRARLLAAAPAVVIIAAATLSAAGCTSETSSAPRLKPSHPSPSKTASHPTTTVPKKVVTAATPPLPTLGSTTVRAEQQGADPYTVSCAYPVISGTATAGAAASINGAIRSSVSSDVVAFEKEADQASSGQVAPLESQLTCTWSKAWLSPTLGAVTLVVSDFRAGAAHPVAAVVTFDFDPATGQMYTLADLFRSGSDWLAVLSQQSRILLPTVIGPEGESYPGFDGDTQPVSSDFTAWELSPSGLSIVFQEYAVAPYAWGNPTIDIPLSALSPIAAPSGPLASLEA